MSYPGTLTALVARDSKHLSCAHHDGYNKNTPLGKTSGVHVRPFRAKGNSSTVDRVATHSTSQFTSTTPRHVFGINDSDWTPPPFGLRESMFGLDHQRKMDCGMIEGPDGGHFHSHRAAANFDIPKPREMGCMARAEEGGGRSKMRVKDRDIRAAGTMNARALSLRKTHIINRAIWLIDGIGQRSDPAGACIARKGSSEGNTEASFSRVAAPFRGAWWAKSYATQHAEHLGVPVMPRNPFSSLDPCDRAGLQRLYSSFDPDGTNKMRFVELLACLMVTHKPEAEAFLEGLQQTFLRNLGAIGSELNEELTKGNRQMSAAFATFLKEHPVQSLEKIVTEDTFEDIFSTQFALLDLFNTQMNAVQAFVKRTLPSN